MNIYFVIFNIIVGSSIIFNFRINISKKHRAPLFLEARHGGYWTGAHLWSRSMTRRRRPCRRRHLPREIEWPHKHLTIISRRISHSSLALGKGLESLDFTEATTLSLVEFVLELNTL